MLAAEALGASAFSKIFKHLIPNVMPLLIVGMTLSLGGVILYESTLSYLGLGVPPPHAAWGSIISASRAPDVLAKYPFIWMPPGICIVLAVLAFNFIGDGLRDAFDPKARR
ncbi:MAG: ABC transporter permease, partial [Clostridiales bacterium]|jgi:peptide/nickel transport system permease protein|nr:ABC transporter permease [Clostridiales bacterium]